MEFVTKGDTFLKPFLLKVFLLVICLFAILWNKKTLTNIDVIVAGVSKSQLLKRARHFVKLPSNNKVGSENMFIQTVCEITDRMTQSLFQRMT